MSKLQVGKAVTAEIVSRLDLPEQIQLSFGESVGYAQEELLALLVRVGLAMLQETMEWEVDRVMGPRGLHDREQAAKHLWPHPGEVTLGGRRIRSAARGFVPLTHAGDWAGWLAGVQFARSVV
jgi:hypothetical protein